MKTKYLWVTLLLPALSFAQTEAKQLEVDIRGRSCSGGLGLCSTVSETSKTTMKNFNVIRQGANVMLLQIEPAKLSVEEQKLFFGKEYDKIGPNETLEFIQDEDFLFEENTLLYLGFDCKYQLLKKGKYLLEITQDQLTVTLTLSER
ncbi:hypothetical protein ABGT15_13925 [Flavobacterium enshiense]|uniref:hypothetical protein n=1 Tax=Flavobacterium enshiense TaxID=1341165 RepID=UPI00345D8852